MRLQTRGKELPSEEEEASFSLNEEKLPEETKSKLEGYLDDVLR